MKKLLVIAALLGAGASHAAGVPTRLAWLGGGELHAAQRGTMAADGAGWHTPLGSTWKLFMYSYLHGRGVQEPAYTCQIGAPQPDEEYCCDPGASIGRDEALARSCGPYFDPKRLGVAGADWSRYWKEQGAPAWLHNLTALQPATDVAVPELLQAIQRIPPAQRSAARQALMPLALRDTAVVSALGSGPRYKTWSWQIGAERAGGAAGWLLDGTPFWFGAAGTSRTALQAQAAWMGEQWRAPALPDAAAVAAEPCVQVRFFQRYPLQSVLRADGSEAPGGPMSGRYRVSFANGTQITIDAVPALVLQPERNGPVIAARLPLEDYVARVIDREGRADETHAARALAVAARSYVLQNATQAEGCRLIADDSRSQRVSPNPPSFPARAAAAFTHELVLEGVAVHYHSTRASPGVMSWQDAVAASRHGTPFDAILRTSYRGAALGSALSSGECVGLPAAEQWLATRQKRWREVLRRHPGYEPPGDSLRVCQLQIGVPHSDQRRLVIHLREWASRDGRVTLIHEYLHLAFRHHPRGRDEAFIEQLAQRLADT